MKKLRPLFMPRARGLGGHVFLATGNGFIHGSGAAFAAGILGSREVETLFDGGSSTSTGDVTIDGGSAGSSGDITLDGLHSKG